MFFRRVYFKRECTSHATYVLCSWRCYHHQFLGLTPNLIRLFQSTALTSDKFSISRVVFKQLSYIHMYKCWFYVVENNDLRTPQIYASITSKNLRKYLAVRWLVLVVIEVSIHNSDMDWHFRYWKWSISAKTRSPSFRRPLVSLAACLSAF